MNRLLSIITNQWLITVLSTAAVVLGVAYFALQTSTPTTVSAAGQASAIQTENRAVPTKVNIDKLDIRTQVTEGHYIDGQAGWTVEDQAASYIQTENSYVIYGHNKPVVFSALKNINTGDTVSISYSDSTTRELVYSHTKLVQPDDTTAIKELDKNTIILLTCHGLFDQWRRLVYFKEV